MLVDLSEDEFEEEVFISKVEARMADTEMASKVLGAEAYDIKAQPAKDVRGRKISAQRRPEILGVAQHPQVNRWTESRGRP